MLYLGEMFVCRFSGCSGCSGLRFLCLCFFYVCYSSNCIAQEGKSVHSDADIATIDKLLSATGGIKDLNTNMDSSLLIFKDVLQKSLAVNYAHGVANAITGIGLIDLDKGNYSHSLTYFLKALPYSLKSTDKKDLAKCYNEIGLSYYYMGDYTKASEYFFNALREIKNADSEYTSVGANIYNNLSNINVSFGQPDKALSYLNKAEDIARTGNHSHELGMTLINKALVLYGTYKSNTETDSARLRFFEVLGIAKMNGFKDLEAFAMSNIAGTYMSSGQYKKAIPYLQHAVSLSKNKSEAMYISSSYGLGLALYSLGRYGDAETAIASILKKASTKNHKDDIIQMYLALSNTYSAMGQYKKALDCTYTIISLKDSLLNLEKAKAINEMDIKYKTSEKDKQIIQNQLLIAQQSSRITRNKMWMLSIASVAALFLIISIAVYRNIIHKQRIQAEHIRSLEQENKINTLKAAVQSEDNERSRLAMELHDGIGGMLSAAIMRLSTVHHKNEAISRIPVYQEAMDILGEMAVEIRKAAHNLMPEVLLKQSLPDAVNTHCNFIRESGKLQIDFQCHGSFDNLTDNFKLNVYRIVQELLNNITHHAKATHAFVQLLINENILIITVEDDGIGFNKGEMKSGLGLHNLQTRVSSLDGHFTIDSEPGKGTSVIIQFEKTET